VRSQQDRLTLLTASMTGEWRLLTAVTDGTTAIGRFQSPQLVFGTVFHIMSRPHRLWLYSEVVWRLISSVALFHDFLNHIFIVFVQWPFVISDTLIVLFTYLVTYLLSYENDKIARVRLPVYFVIVLRVVVPGRSWSSLERNRRVVNCWLSLIVSSH